MLPAPEWQVLVKEANDCILELTPSLRMNKFQGSEAVTVLFLDRPAGLHACPAAYQDEGVPGRQDHVMGLRGLGCFAEGCYAGAPSCKTVRRSNASPCSPVA